MAGRIRDEDVALVRERTSIVDVVSEYVTLKPAGGGNVKGLCPFHDEKTPSFNVAAAQGRLLLLRLRRGRRRDHLRHDPGAPVASSRPSSGSRPRPASQLQLRRGRARPGARPARASASGSSARTRPPPSSTPTSSARPGARAAREFLAQRGFDQAAAETYGCGFAPEGWDPLTKHLRQKGFTAHGAGDRRAGQGGPLGQPHRPVPAPAALADPRPDRRRDRLRRPQAVRRRRRPQVPQHPGDAAVQEVARPLRHRPGQAGDRQAGPGGDRRGLHRRDGLPPGRRADRGGHLRHRVRRRPHRRAAPAADGHRRATAARSSSPSTATRPGRRRRCARSRTTSGSSRRRSSRSARTTWTRASCAWPRATWRCATWWPGASR